MIYSPDVIVVKTDTLAPERLSREDWYPVNVITCAAPDLRKRILDKETGFSVEDLTEEALCGILESRIRKIFQKAAAEGNEVLILGAFGCGAFRNPPNLVADVFRRVTEEFSRSFETIEYAVFHSGSESENFLAFQKAFASMT